MDRVARDRLDTLVARVLVAMEGMERDAEPGAFTYRRDEAIALVGLDEKAVADRILHAPRPYLLSELPERIVAHARLMEPRPERREVRLVIGYARRPRTHHRRCRARTRPACSPR